MRRNNGGFTLIELIVVIVILGILAVTAAPKFIDLQSDARLATLNGMKAAINSAVSLTYGKSLVKGVEKYPSDKKVSINGEEVEVCYGYPCAAATKIQKVLDIGVFEPCSGNSTSGNSTRGNSTSGNSTSGNSTSARDWCYTGGGDSESSIKIYVANGYSSGSKCYVEYKQPDASGKAPTVTLPTDEHGNINVEC